MDVNNKGYKYTSEIAQMLFVAGEVQGNSLDTCQKVEDVVRGQVIELAMQARQIAARRGSKSLSPEDLIFLIRNDRQKVNRLRTYLSWKDVRKNAKDSENSAGVPGAGDAGVEGIAVDEGSNEKQIAKPIRKAVVRLPWDITTMYTDFLRHHQSQHGGTGGQNEEDEEEEDEEEIEAQEDIMQRLKDADDITKDMSREDYAHYSECRQASFTYRKAKRFREFVNLAAYLDVKPSDDIIDILGFLSYEMVHSLTTRALEVKRRYEEDALPYHFVASTSAPLAESPPSPKKRKLSITAAGQEETTSTSSPNKKKTRTKSFSGPSDQPPTCGLFYSPSERTPLEPWHIFEAFSSIQRKDQTLRLAGMNNWRGGSGGTRTRMALV